MDNEQMAGMNKRKTGIFLVAVGIVVVILLLAGLGKWDIAVIFAGLVIFFGALALALKDNELDLGKLHSGEIRKSIAIAFTTVYLVLLPYYFFNIYKPAANNITTQSAQLQTFNITASAVPAIALADLLKNFLYVYITIIIFYFASRSFDSYSDSKSTEALKAKSPLEIAEMRYARGKISKDDLVEIENELGTRTALADNKEALEKIKAMWNASDVKTIAKAINYPENIVKEMTDKMIQSQDLMKK